MILGVFFIITYNYIFLLFVKYLLSKEINNKEKFSFVINSLKTSVLVSFFFCVEIFFKFFQKNAITTLIFSKKCPYIIGE